MYLPSTNTACELERRTAAVCRGPEAGDVQQHLLSHLSHPAQAAALWLFWVQWRALGRDALSRETELSPWVISDRLRRLRDAGIAVPSWSEERDSIARGRFYSE